MKQGLRESLHTGDLNHLVLPLISIDEFSSKIDNRRAIVVGFYCTDESPAQDLMRFIEGSNLDILDTEVSPAPTSEGYYVVFVEFNRNQDFPIVLAEIIEQVENIAENAWQIKVYNHSDIVPYSEENVKKLVVLNPAAIPPDPEETSEPVTEPVAKAQAAAEPEPIAEHEFWQQAEVDRVLVSETHVAFSGSGTMRSYLRAPDSSDFGRLHLEETLNVQALRRMLGSQYQVYSYDQGIVVQNGSDYRILKES